MVSQYKKRIRVQGDNKPCIIRDSIDLHILQSGRPEGYSAICTVERKFHLSARTMRNRVSKIIFRIIAIIAIQFLGGCFTSQAEDVSLYLTQYPNSTSVGFGEQIDYVYEILPETLKIWSPKEFYSVSIDGVEIIYDSDKINSASIDVTPYCDGYVHTITIEGESRFGKIETSSRKIVSVVSDGVHEFVITNNFCNYLGLAEGCPVMQEVAIPSTFEYNGVEYPVRTITKHGLNNSYSSDLHKKIKKITIPNSVMRIHYAAFSGFDKLENLIIQDGYDSLYMEEKYSYERNSVGTFGSGNLRSLYLGRNLSLPRYNKHPFHPGYSDTNNLLTIQIGPNVSTIPENVFDNSIEATEIIFSEGLKTIGSEAFYNSKKITQIDLPESLEYIGSSSFCGCDNLHTVISNNETAPQNENAFDSNIYDNGLLILPNGGKDTYLADSCWKRFSNIVEGELITAESIIIDTDAIFIDVNSSFQLPVAVMPDNASIKKFKWSSSNPWIISVDDYGLITASDVPGTVTISANTIDGSNLTASIEVTSIYKSGVEDICDEEIPHFEAIGNTIYVSGKHPDQMVRVFSAQGMLLLTTMDDEFSVAGQGVVIVTVGNQSKKIVL